MNIRRKRHLAWLPMIAAAAVLLSGCGSDQAQLSSAPSLFGPFAGYNWQGQVHAVNAQLTVPHVLRRSGTGVAASWIGATGLDAPGGVTAPFIQVGINVVRKTFSGRMRDLYFAFWSDAEIGFHPRVMVQVKPGDQVRLSLVRKPGHWIVAVKDDDTSAAKRLVIGQELSGPFVSATFTQEDVSDSQTAGQLPYPRLSAVTFSKLGVNGHPPARVRLTDTWMSTSIGTFAPTAVHGNSFGIRKAHPSAEALHYQRIVLPEDENVDAYGTALARWTSHTKQRTIRRATRRLAHALQMNAEALKRYHWSKNVASLVTKLAGVTERLRGGLLKVVATRPAKLSALEEVLESHDPEHQISLAIKARLHLPVTGFSGGALARYIRTHPA